MPTNGQDIWILYFYLLTIEYFRKQNATPNANASYMKERFTPDNANGNKALLVTLYTKGRISHFMVRRQLLFWRIKFFLTANKFSSWLTTNTDTVHCRQSGTPWLHLSLPHTRAMRWAKSRAREHQPKLVPPACSDVLQTFVYACHLHRVLMQHVEWFGAWVHILAAPTCAGSESKVCHPKK